MQIVAKGYGTPDMLEAQGTYAHPPRGNGPSIYKSGNKKFQITAAIVGSSFWRVFSVSVGESIAVAYLATLNRPHENAHAE